MEGYVHRPQFELYRVATDPTESLNLAGDPEFEPVLEDMKQRLKAFQKETGDPWAMKWRYE